MLAIQFYCARRWVVSTRLLVLSLRGYILSRQLMGCPAKDFSAEVLTAPPLPLAGFPYRKWAEADIVLVRLHGKMNQPYFYDGNWQTVLSLTDLQQSSLQFTRPAKFFFEGCFACQTGIPAALIAMGAQEVIASTTTTYDNKIRVGPAGKVAGAVLRAWLMGQDVEAALDRANRRQKKYTMKFIRLL